MYIKKTLFEIAIFSNNGRIHKNNGRIYKTLTLPLVLSPVVTEDFVTLQAILDRR